LEIVCPAWLPGVSKLVEAIPLLANQGATAIEINLNDPGYLDWTEIDEVQDLMIALADSGVRVHSVHSPYGADFDISSLEDDVHERGVDALIESVELANLFGAGMVVVHASHRLQGSPNGRFERARGVLRELSLVARETGIVLALENLPPEHLGHTPHDLMELLDGCEKSGIAVCFDAGHANLSGCFAEFTRALLPRSITANLHDNDGTKDEHKFPGQGTIDWAVFGDAYRKSGCNASIVLECPPPEDMPWKEAFQQLRSALGD
jgi:sugar phosphate isomerase/epimerase